MVLWDGPRLQKRIQSRTGNNTLLKVLILGTLNQESKTLILALLQKEILVSSSERAKNGHHICNKADATFLPSRHFSLLPHHLLFPPHGAAGSRGCPSRAGPVHSPVHSQPEQTMGACGPQQCRKEEGKEQSHHPFLGSFHVCLVGTPQAELAAAAEAQLQLN